MLFPSTACLVQENIGATKAWGFDLVAACSGFVYGLTTAASFVGSGLHKKVLVIGADTMSRIIDYEDRTTCILFGDGAGAMLVEAAGEAESALGFIDFIGEIDGSGGKYLRMPAGGSRHPGQRRNGREENALRASGRPAGFQIRRARRCRKSAWRCSSATDSRRPIWGF